MKEKTQKLILEIAGSALIGAVIGFVAYIGIPA